MGGEAGRQDSLELVESRIGVRAGEDAKYRVDAVQQRAAALEGYDGVVESRGHGIVRDVSDFPEVFLHALLERGREMLVLDRGERRQLVRQGAFRQKRIGHGRWSGFRCQHIDAQQGSQRERRQCRTKGR